MPVSIEAEMKTDRGELYKFEIYDADWALATVTAKCNDFRLNWTPSNQELVCPIITSALDLEIIDDGTTNLAAAIDSISTNFEDDCQIVVSRDTGSGYEQWWVGIVVKENLMLANAPEPITFNFNAVDGLSRLKDIEYPGIANGTHTGPSQLAQFITECLSENGLAGFWGISDAYIKESIEWTSNAATTPSDDSPLLHTRCDVLHFRKDRDSPETTNRSCYEVIEAIMLLFGAQFFHAEGVYYIRQPRNYDTTTHTERTITKQLGETIGTPTNRVTAQSTTPAIDEVVIMSAGNWMYAPPLDKVRARVNPILQINYEREDSVKLDNSDKDHTFSYDLGDIRGGAGNGIVLEFIGEYEQYTNDDLLYVTLTVTLPDTPNYYLNRKTNGDLEWTTTLSSVAWYPTLDRNQTLITWQIITPEIPVTFSEGVTASVKYEIFDPNTGTYPTSTDDAYKIEQPAINVINLNDTGLDQFDEIEIDVDNFLSSGNSRILDLGSVWFNDKTDGSNRNSFEADSNGVDWVAATTWDCGFSTDYDLAYSMMIERMSYQQRPVKRYRGRVFGTITPRMALVFNSEVYVCNRLEFSAKQNILTGDWWKLNQAVTSITMGDERNKGRLRDKLPVRRNPRQGEQRQGYYEFEKVALVGDWINDGDTVTSVDLLNAVGHTNVRDGDTISIRHPFTHEEIETFEVSSDVGAADGSISVVSKTAGATIKTGFVIMLRSDELVSTEKSRAEQFVMMQQTADTDADNRSAFESSDSGQMSYKNSNGVVSPLGEMVEETSLSQAQIQSLNSTPVSVVGAAPSGYYYDVQRITIFYDHNGTEFSGTASATLEVEYATSGTRVAFDTSDIFLETADYNGQLTIDNIYHNSGLRDLSNLDGNALQIKNSVAYTGAGGSATVRVYYKIIKI